MRFSFRHRLAVSIPGALATIALCASQAAFADDSLSAQARPVPSAAMTWCYSVGTGPATRLRLEEVKSGIAYNKAVTSGVPHRFEERFDTFTSVNATRKGQRTVLAFPLVKDKHWRDAFDETLTSSFGGGRSWQYRYKASADSVVLGTAKIEVGAGSFDTWVIQRSTSWTKSQPRATSALPFDVKCGSPACSASGYSRETLWYAPAVGRVILRAYAQSGSAPWLWKQTPEDMLRDATTLVIARHA